MQYKLYKMERIRPQQEEPGMFSKLFSYFGGQEKEPLKYAFMSGEQKRGETQVMIHSQLKDGKEIPIKFNGHSTIKEVFESNAATVPEKPFIGTREKLLGENGAITYGEYQWKNYG